MPTPSTPNRTPARPQDHETHGRVRWLVGLLDHHCHSLCGSILNHFAFAPGQTVSCDGQHQPKPAPTNVLWEILGTASEKELPNFSGT